MTRNFSGLVSSFAELQCIKECKISSTFSFQHVLVVVVGGGGGGGEGEVNKTEHFFRPKLSNVFLQSYTNVCTKVFKTTFHNCILFFCHLFQAGAGAASKDKSSFVGENAYVQRGFLDISCPVERGMVSNWADMEQLWRHMFDDLLNVRPEDRKVMLADSCRNAVHRLSREKMTQIMFEEFKVGHFYVIDQALLALYASGRLNGIVIDCGYGLTQVVPVKEGYVERQGVITSDLAGNDLTLQLADMLSKKGSFSFSTSAIKDDVDEIKKAACYIAMNYDQELQASGSAETSFNLPNGQFLKNVKLGNERFKCPECLFKPYLAGVDSTGLHDKVYHSITKCPADLQKALYSNVVLSGATTLLPGFADRLQKEIKSLVAQDTTVKLIAPPERRISAWIGGSILASLSTFGQMWITKNEYDENGPNIVHRKCF